MIPVIVPTYKSPEKLKRCLKHLEAQTISEELKIHVINNDENNRLYTKAMNEGILWTREINLPSKYVLLLCDDVYLGPQCIEFLRDFLDQNPKCGIAAPEQRNPEGFPTWVGSKRSFPTGEHELIPSVHPRTTPWVNGACMLIRQDMINRIGLLDENMRFICSDSDYSFTARSRGWTTYVVSEARCEHSLGGSGSMGKNPWLDLIKIEDLQYFTSKWVNGELFKSLEYDGHEISNGMIKTFTYSLDNAKKRLVAQNAGLSSLSFGSSEIGEIALKSENKITDGHFASRG